MNNDITKETMAMVIEKLGLKDGDEFILKHYANENQNDYSGIVFCVGDNKIEPEVNIWHVCSGKYSIEKVWDDNSKECILSLNENNESLYFRLRNCNKYENCP